jgi:hypothetical protein
MLSEDAKQQLRLHKMTIDEWERKASQEEVEKD